MANMPVRYINKSQPVEVERLFTASDGVIKKLKHSPVGWWCIDAAIAVANFVEGDELTIWWN